MSDAFEEFEKKLNDAKIKYINSLPGKISEITLIWNQLNKVEWRNEVKLKLQNLAHNLAGSGSTFGFPKLSEQAKMLELALGKLQDNAEGRPNEQQLEEIDELLISLQEVELNTIRENPALPTPMNRADLVYILDSDKDSAFNTARQLMFYGCSVKVINEVSSLESNFKNSSPLLILIDSNFAEIMLDKHTVVQTLRKTWLVDCPIIFISSRDDFDSRITAIKAGASAYFTKPMDVALLVERIHILTNAGIVEPYRVLIVEDDAELAKYYKIILERGGMKVFIETQPELALNRILELNPELVVLDLYMPNYNGIDLIKVIRQHQSLYTLPIILLTAERDVNLQYLAREQGVDDFLLKPITESHLYESVLNKVQRARYMNISMTKDSLTGLFVHKKITEYLEVHINICKRYKRILSYVIIDIDNFKTINDTYGHIAGDNVLITLANLLKTSVRVTDFVGRYGGEEFVIVFPETDEHAAFITIERLRERFSQTKHFANNSEFYVTFSAGVSSFPKFEDVDVLMAAADKALYHSKDKGRNQVNIG